MTDKELRKLNRRELLQLMLDQGKETLELRQSLEETCAELETLQSNYERLKKRLDQKDIQIRQLTETLEAERTKREIELEEAGSIAEAALRLNGVFEAAQAAAEQYLYNVRLASEHRRREEANSSDEELAETQEDNLEDTPSIEDTASMEGKISIEDTEKETEDMKNDPQPSQREEGLKEAGAEDN